MLKILAPVALSALLVVTPSTASQGLLHIDSAYDVGETAQRLETLLREKGMTVFNRINHAQGAKTAGIAMNDTELLIFGNPKVGSQLMLCQPMVAIDLPQKALIWEDDAGAVRISYNDPGYLKQRHSISGCDEWLAKISDTLAKLLRTAAGSDSRSAADQ